MGGDRLLILGRLGELENRLADVERMHRLVEVGRHADLESGLLAVNDPALNRLEILGRQKASLDAVLDSDVAATAIDHRVDVLALHRADQHRHQQPVSCDVCHKCWIGHVVLAGIQLVKYQLLEWDGDQLVGYRIIAHRKRDHSHA